MDVRFEKAWNQLRKQDRAIIEKVKADEALQIVIHEEAELQKKWLKALCIVFNKNKGYGRDRLLLVLGWWKEMYRIIKSYPTNEELDAYLDSEMDRIFGEGGFPQKYLDKLEDM
jgi:hypothetical protein